MVNAMIAEKTDVQSLHFEHRLWDNELKFFIDEMGIFEHRLEDMVKKHDEPEALMRLEQFQNKFIRQKAVLQELAHDIKIHEQTIAGLLKAGFGTPEHKVSDHTLLRDRMERFREIYAEVKEDFYRYLLVWK